MVETPTFDPANAPGGITAPAAGSVTHDQPWLISVGRVACAALAGAPLAGLEGLDIDDCVLNMHRIAGVGDGSDDSALHKAIASAHAQIQLRLVGTRHALTLLVVDAACPAGRAVGLAVAQTLQAHQVRFVSVVLTARLHQGKAAAIAAQQACSQLQAISPASLVVDGQRFGPLDSPVPYLQHACRTLLLATDSDGFVSMGVDDVFGALVGPHSHMGHAVVQRSPWLAADLMEQLVAGQQLLRSELQLARGVLVLVEGAKGHIKLTDARDIMHTVQRETAPDVQVTYAAAYADRPEGELGVTVLLAY